MINEEEKKHIIGIISVFVPNATIYVFGSHARGDATPKSDLDVAIDQGDKVHYEILSELKTVLDALYISYKIDLVDLQRATGKFKANILKERVVWKN